MKIYQVDAFTDRPFAGNPAAVCLPDAPLDDRLMQQIAAETNLSDTAFVQIRENRTCGLRWFTPLVEVELCGHATLATAHVLFEQKLFAPDEIIRFDTLSGELRVSRLEDNRLEMDLPALSSQLVDIPDRTVQALGTKVVFCGIVSEATSEASLHGTVGTAPEEDATRPRKYLIEVADEKTLRGLQPDFSLLQQEPAHGYAVTAPADGGKYDFVSRYFAPRVGVNEDPVTGSAHCLLAPYWAKKLNKTVLSAYQASARGGELGLSLRGDRVHIIGQAVTVMRGELLALEGRE